MKKQILMPTIIMAILLNSALAFASGNTYTFNVYDKNTQNQINNFDAVYYQCNIDACLDTFEPFKFSTKNSGNSNRVTQEFLGTSHLNPADYLTIIYDQCHLPLSIRVHDDWGYGQTYNYDFDMKKAAECRSPIESYVILNNASVNKPLWINVTATLDADTHSAFGKTNFPPLYTPIGYEHHFSANTKITLEIINQLGQIVHTESITEEILADTIKHASFVWMPNTAGTYSARITTEVVDCQCESNIKEYVETNFEVLPEKPEDSCYTILNDLETNSEFPEAGETITFSVKKISNYADGASSLTPVSTIIFWDAVNLSNGDIILTTSEVYDANPDDYNPVSASFDWTPTTDGQYMIRAIANSNDNLCFGIDNFGQFTSLTLAVKEKLVLCTDNDNDGFFIEGETCGAIDCNDNNALINPTATEICNGLDDNCDGLIDEGEVLCGGPVCIPATEICNGVDDDCDNLIDEGVETVFYRDYDQDSFGNQYNSVQECFTPYGYINNNDDCDDTDNGINPNALEICDSLDNDCDGIADEGNVCTPVCIPAAEICNGLDDDCDNLVDEDNVCTVYNYYCDKDLDSYFNTLSDGSCIGDSCYPSFCRQSQGNDCNDQNFFINPNRVEIPYDGIDQNCDGIDLRDIDQDGYDFTIDCNDLNPSINPGAAEICSGVDDNCNGLIDEGGVCGPVCVPTTEICDGVDNDCNNLIDENLFRTTTCGVGVCTGNTGQETCTLGVWGGNTCNPFDGATTETCNTVDDDCDAQTDEGIVCTAYNYYCDKDLDSYFNTLSDGSCIGDSCYPSFCRQSQGNDCSDINTYINPGATETCDLIDNDCNGLVDEGSVCAPICIPTTEVCDGLDNDCDNLVDEDGVCYVDNDLSFTITANPTSGIIPLKVYFKSEIHGGNAPFTYLWSFGDGFSSNEINIYHTYKDEGNFIASLAVTDFDGDTASASINIDVDEDNAITDSRGAIYISEVSFIDDTLNAGDVLEAIVSFKNNAGKDIKEASVTVSIPELGIARTLKDYELDDGESFSRIFFLDLPEYIEAGYYDVRMSISGDSGAYRREVYREIMIN